MSPPPTPDIWTPMLRRVAAPWALLLRVVRRWRSKGSAQPYRRSAYAPLRDNEFR